jgi:hypothetical protein
VTDFTPVNVTFGPYTKAPGVPSSGYFDFALNTNLVNNSNWHSYSETSFRVIFDGNGSGVAPLVAVDDTTTEPVGAVWTVSGEIDGVDITPKSFILSTSDAPTVPLESLTPIAPVPLVYPYATEADVIGERGRAEAAEAALQATLSALSATAWQANTPYIAEKIVSNGVGLYEAPTGGVPSRTTFTASDWAHLADIALPVGTTVGTVASGETPALAQAAAIAAAATDATTKANNAQAAAEAASDAVGSASTALSTATGRAAAFALVLGG